MESYYAAQLIFIDETAKDERTATRNYGYYTVNRPAQARAVFVRGKRYTILPALTLDGFEAVKVIDGSCTREIFRKFILNDVVSI
jgi:hypothetical protein